MGKGSTSSAWRVRLAAKKFDMLIVSAGVTPANHGTAAEVSTEEMSSRSGSIPNLADTMDAQAGNPGLRCLDYPGRRVPRWGDLSLIPAQAARVAPVETADRPGDFARRFCAAIRIDMKRMPATSTTKVTIQNTSCMPAGRAS